MRFRAIDFRMSIMLWGSWSTKDGQFIRSLRRKQGKVKRLDNARQVTCWSPKRKRPGLKAPVKYAMMLPDATKRCARMVVVEEDSNLPVTSEEGAVTLVGSQVGGDLFRKALQSDVGR